MGALQGPWRSRGVLSAVGTLALNTLLSIFFFSFFLGKLAAFRQRNGAEVRKAITFAKPI